MSYFDDECPPPYEARRQGERAYENDSYHNPYRGRCPDAAYQWDCGRREAEYRHEEEIEERRAHERAVAARMEEERQYEEYLTAQRAEEDLYYASESSPSEPIDSLANESLSGEEKK